MEKTRIWIGKYIADFKSRLQKRLETLSSKARLRLVLTVFVMFALLCLYMIAASVVNFGKGKNGAIQIRHIEKLDLPKQESMNLYNDMYGKGKEE